MTSASLRPLSFLIYVVAITIAPSANTSAEAPAIEFDMAPLAVAHPISDPSESSLAVDLMRDETLVVCELNLSSMIAAPRTPAHRSVAGSLPASRRIRDDR